MTLHDLPVGGRARVLEVHAQALHVRMASMGLRPGALVTVVSRGASGSRLVRVGDARLSVARELARAIAVEVVDVQ